MANVRKKIIVTILFAVPLLIILSLFLQSQNLLAQSFNSKPELSLDSRYIQGYSNKAVGQFGIELIDLITLPADLLIKPGRRSNRLHRVGRGLLIVIGSAIFSSSYVFAYHEYGHGTRSAAIGFKPYYGHGTINSEAELQAALSGASKLHDNFLSFFVASITKTRGFMITKPGDTLFEPLTEELNNGWNGLISAGGLNNEMLFTEFIEDKMYRSGSHIGFLIPYITGKLAAQIYETNNVGGTLNDVTNIVRDYQNRGINVDSDKIRTSSMISLFSSALSYQFVYQFSQKLKGKSARFRPLEYRGLQLPNTHFYMNTGGLSYKIRSGYRSGTWRFPFSVEYLFEGDSRAEFTLGAEKRFVDFNAAVETVIGKQIELALDMSYRQSKWFTLSGGYALYDRRNLHGERFIPSLEHGSVYQEIYLRTSFAY